MAKYKTNIEAQQALVKELEAKARELRPIYDTTDRVLKVKADQLKADIGKIQNQLMMTGGVGAFGGGIASGVTSLLTGLPDLAIAGYNKLTGSNVKGLAETFQPGLESVSQEQAGLFGAGRGIGSSVGMGKALTALNIGTNITDETLFEGTPVTQLLAAAGMLTKVGISGIQNWQENRGIKQIVKQLGPDGANKLRDFMIRGQDSADPAIAGVVAKLRQDPRYAEIFNVLEKKATEAATAGARVTTKGGYNVEDTGKGIFQAVDAHVSGLKEKIKTAGGPAYNKAFEMAGDTPMVVTDNTQAKIADLISAYNKSDLPDSKNTVKFLENLQESLTNGVFQKKMSIPQLQAWLTDFGKKAAGAESLITDVSIGTQQKIASAIFGGLKDDLKALAQSSNVDERAVSNLMQTASKKTKEAVDAYQASIAQGLPEILRNKNIASIDTETLLKTIGGLSSAQQRSLFGILKNTAPEDLKRIQQVNYDNFVQSARTVLPDGSTGVDLKLLATKFNTLPAEEQSKLALSLGTSLEDFSSRMKDAENFFKYQQRFAGKVEGAPLTATELAELSSAGYLAAGYGAGKGLGLMGRMWNTIKGGLSDENMLNFLMSPETKNILKESISNPNSVKTVEKISRVLGARQMAGTAGEAARIGTQGVVSGVTGAEPAPVQKERPAIDLTAPEEPTTTPTGERPALDLSYNTQDIEQQIRAEAERQGMGQYADLFVKQAQQESGLNPYAVSPKGASGIFQHMPATAQELGIDTFNPEQSIQGGVQYMGQLLNKYKDPRTALAAYNWGMGNVNRQGMENMPVETQNYIKAILG